MPNHQQRWPAVGELLTRRMRQLGLTYAEASRESGVSFKTLKRYLSGEPIVRTDKRRRLLAALKLPSNAIDRILEMEPSDVELTPASSLADILAEAERRAALDPTFGQQLARAFQESGMVIEPNDAATRTDRRRIVDELEARIEELERQVATLQVVAREELTDDDAEMPPGPDANDAEARVD